MNTEKPLTKAKFIPQTGPERNQEIEVHFNPATLDYTVSNTLENQGEGDQSRQYVTSSSAKLTMSLLFDTTHSGDDVRGITGRISKLMQPVDENGERNVPAVVKFEWGVYTFQGLVESFKETIDFFSPDGVPLRSTVALGMASQDVVFAPSDDAASQPNEPVALPGGQSATQLGTQAGNPGAGRAIAAANNQASMRFSSGPVAISASVELNAAASFSAGVGLGAGLSAGIGGGASAGFGISAGASGGLSAGISGGAGISAGAGIGASIGGQASAGVSASAGAFNGLSVAAAKPAKFKLNTSQLLPAPSNIQSHQTSNDSAFQVGGMVSGSGGLKAKVGANASSGAKIKFEGN